jgi:hypothetical protein
VLRYLGGTDEESSAPITLRIWVKFIVEDDAQRLAARASDPAGLLLIEAVQFGNE